jgi:hypothetical protein
MTAYIPQINTIKCLNRLLVRDYYYFYHLVNLFIYAHYMFRLSQSHHQVCLFTKHVTLHLL